MATRRFAFVILIVLMVIRLAPAADLRIDFTEEKLDNGLHVIYAPLHQSPVVHVRIHYHVGSRDERPDRQGFAHMFEHMMFRGSAHVKSEDHQLLMQKVGGSASAFTEYDQTVYENTLPANQLELALYLEADRMASFKVSDETFQIERNVVFEEMRRGENQLYAGVYDELSRLLFTKHSYRWSRIGQMPHLNAAKAPELQQFFNTYYIPNNATLIIAGDIDMGTAKALVQKYFAWIPKGAQILRQIPPEPAQNEPRRSELFQPVPLPYVIIAWHGPPATSDDHYALNLLSTILGRGRFSRLNRFLQARDSGKAASVNALNYGLEDGGYFMVGATVLPGKDPREVEKDLAFIVNSIRENGITREDLLKAKITQRLDFVYDLATAKSIAVQLGNQAILAGDASRVNSATSKIENITARDIQAVARKYLPPEASTVLHTTPRPASQPSPPAVGKDAEAAQLPANPVSPPRAITFPPDYPQQAPIAPPHLELKFPRGAQWTINGVTVVVMSDHRLPTVSWRLTLRSGIHHDPVGKEGLAHLTAHVINDNIHDEDLEARGISLSLKEENETTSFQGYCLTEDTEFALSRMRETLLGLNLRERLFADFKLHALTALRYMNTEPATAARQAMARALFDSSPMGRFASAKTIESISFEDIQAAHERLFCSNDAIFVIAGDITAQRGQELAQKLLDGWKPGVLPNTDFTLPPPLQKRRIILIDRPESKQAVIYVGTRGYDLQSDENVAGTLAGAILTTRLNLRLGRQKGLIYTGRAYFEAARHSGQFVANTETDFPTAATSIDGILNLFDEAGKIPARDTELNDARLWTLGATAMFLQTIGYQASYREAIILYNLPIDYYQSFSQRLGQVTPEQVRQVVSKYLQPQGMVIVVVAPVAAVKSQLERFGTVEVQPMP